MATPVRTGLDEFRDFAGDFHSLSALVAKGTVALPLVALVTEVGPPWPPGIALATSFAQLLVLVLLFQFWHRAAQHRFRRGVVLAASLLFASFFLYLVLLNALVVDIPGDVRGVVGFVVRPDVRPLLGVDFSALHALESAEYDAAQVWTTGSLAAARITLAASWLLLFVSVTGVLGLFVLGQRRRRVR
jgi:hypothetical protein